MLHRFEIVDLSSARPDAKRIIFCDGTGGKLFRPETDMELSHWRPNATPAEYRAGTSTEICFRFLDNPRPGPWTIAVNNHVDVDGILSVYVLLHREHALAHRRTIIQAAEMGDFWGWGDPPAQRVFQGLTRLMSSAHEGMAVYTEAFRRLPALIDGADKDVELIERTLEALRHAVQLVEQRRIARCLLASHLAHYVVPLDVAGDDDRRASYCPEFNEEISDKAVFWPHVRARWDAQRACLVSAQRDHGWYHDLWLPGYLWADTQGLWRTPGLTYHDGMSNYQLDNSRLVAAFEQLQRQEAKPGFWGLGGTTLPFGMELQAQFPLVGRFVDDQQRAAVSGLPPEPVAKALERVFES